MSFGISALTNGEAIDKDEMIERADAALYNAKRAGKNRCCIYS
jgi:PleD family two-component response regulator